MATEPGDDELAQKFHETYERLAPEFNYSTRKASAVPWSDVPPNNKALMIAVAHEVRAGVATHNTPESDGTEWVGYYEHGDRLPLKQIARVRRDITAEQAAPIIRDLTLLVPTSKETSDE